MYGFSGGHRVVAGAHRKVVVYNQQATIVCCKGIQIDSRPVLTAAVNDSMPVWCTAGGYIAARVEVKRKQISFMLKEW
jgi:hypothetical protein